MPAVGGRSAQSEVAALGLSSPPVRGRATVFMCDVHVWRDSFMCDMTYYVWRDSFACDMTYLRDTTHSCVIWFIIPFISERHEHACVAWMCICYMPPSYVPCLIHLLHDSFMCDMTHSCAPWLIHVWYDSFMCAMTHSWIARLIHVWYDLFMSGMTHCDVTWPVQVCHDSFMCPMTHSWLIHVCAMTHSRVCHDLFMRVPWLIHVPHDSFMCVPWLIRVCARLIRVCAMTHSRVCHDSSMCVPWLIHVCAMTHSSVTHLIHEARSRYIYGWRSKSIGTYLWTWCFMRSMIHMKELCDTHTPVYSHSSLSYTSEMPIHFQLHISFVTCLFQISQKTSSLLLSALHPQTHRHTGTHTQTRIHTHAHTHARAHTQCSWKPALDHSL